MAARRHNPGKTPPPPKHAGLDQLAEWRKATGRIEPSEVEVGWSLHVGRLTITSHLDKLGRGAIGKLRKVTRA